MQLMNAVLILVLDLFQELKCPFLLSIWTDELISTPKIIALLPKLPVGCEKKNAFPLNPMPYPKYLFFSTSAFLVNLTALNKQFS